MRSPRFTSRSGLSLTEIMVVLVIGILLIGVLTPNLAAFFLLDQRSAAKELALLYEQLHDEAVMRNVTFRVAYNLRTNTYEVQVGDPKVLIHTDPQKREEFEDMVRRRMDQMSDAEREEFLGKRRQFQKLDARFKTAFELPSGTVFGGVYTPQYEEMMRPDDLDEDFDGIVYSYIFANGQSEHAVILMVTEGDEDDGYTIEVEPLSGAVRLHGEVIDWEDSHDFVPDEAPDLPSQ